MNILITGSRAPVALDLARRFAKAGHRVWLGDSLKHTLGSYSRYIQSHIVLPRPVGQPLTYRKSLERAVTDRSLDRIIPTCEEVFYFDDSWTDSGLALRSHTSTLKLIHNKLSFAKFVEQIQEVDVSAPQTFLLTSADDLHAFDKETHQWVFKPVYSRFASRTLIGPSVSELTRCVVPATNGPWVAQKRIQGTEYSTYGISHAGKLTAFCCYHSIYKAGKGSGILFERHEDARIRNFAAKLVRELNFTGQLGLDYIEDHNGYLWILEGNPRATSGIHLFGDGDDLVSGLLNTNEQLVIPSGGRPVMLSFAMPFWGLMHAFKTGRLSKFFGDCFRAKDAIFAWNDLPPCAAIIPAFVELLAISMREKRTLQEASTYDIEWNGGPLE